jgi:hypothetical protein
LELGFRRRSVEASRHARESVLIRRLSPRQHGPMDVRRDFLHLIWAKLGCPGRVLSRPQVTERDLRRSEKVLWGYRDLHATLLLSKTSTTAPMPHLRAAGSTGRMRS